MKAVVIHYSVFGHTRQIAEAVGERLAAEAEVRVIGIDQLRPADLAGASLVVMGCPTHRMRLPEAVKPLFESLPRHLLRGAHVAAFDTSYRMSAFLARFTAAKTLEGKLRKLGGKRIVPPETFFIAAREGPLEDDEVARAQAWADAILDRVRTGSEGHEK